MEFVLIRHTPCDVETGTCYGHLDVPLRASADDDMALTASKVPALDVIYASPATRCLKLSQRLAQRDECDIHVLSDLRELNFGDWEGIRWDVIPREFCDFWAIDSWNRSPPGGESESELFTRVERAYRVAANARRQRVGIVAHAGSLRLIRCLAQGLPIGERWNWAIEPGGVHVIPCENPQVVPFAEAFGLADTGLSRRH